MATQRIWLLGSAVVAVAVIALGWLLGISPKLDEIAAADEELITVQAQNQIAEAELTALKQQFEQLPDLQAQLAALQREVTPINDFTQFVDYLGRLSAEKGATLLKYEKDVPAATVLVQDPASAPVGSVAVEEGSTGPQEAAAETPTQVPVGSASLFAIPITISLDGTDDQILDVVKALQTGEQLFLATDLAFGGETERVVKGYVYVLADPEIVQAATEAAAVVS